MIAFKYRVGKFKLGDLVYAPFHGYGMITEILKEPCAYPIVVTWFATNVHLVESESTFTADGYLSVYAKESDALKITVVKRRHNNSDRTLLNRFRSFLKGE